MSRVIAPLHQHPHLADVLAPLHVAEWAHLYPPAWDVETARAELLATADAGVPITFVLLDDGALVGSVSLIEDDLPGRSELGPWLASLFVLPRYRGSGAARALVDALLAHARAVGVSSVHLFTESAEGLFARFGFAPVERLELRGHPITRMCMELGVADRASGA